MILPRTLTVLIGAPLILFIIHQGSVPFAALVAGIAVLCLYEYGVILTCGGKPIHRNLTILGGVALCLSALNQGLFSLCLALFLLSILLAEIATRRRSLERIALDLLGAVLVGWTLGHLILIREVRPYGQDLTYLLFLTVWIMDSAAFWVGSLAGRKKLAPTLSPGKTWEGSLASFFAAVAASWGFCRSVLPSVYTPRQAVAMGALIGVCGQISDLAESVIKRTVGAKDSAYLLPGHGGVLDRFDSFLLAAPIFYYLLPLL